MLPAHAFPALLFQHWVKYCRYRFPVLPVGVEKTSQIDWNLPAIAATIQQSIAGYLNREPSDVVITRGPEGQIVFEGQGMLGRAVDMNQVVELTIAAIEGGATDVLLPVRELQPSVDVRDRQLRDWGIREIVSVGESDYSGSPSNRRHNIAVGLSKFNGHVIASGATFSFNEMLGPVNARTGYKKELGILGDKTLPEYGGGLCQVSTTAYRGVWEYGFPISQRRNHSYAVQYYGPQGTDATIYPPHTDMKFDNDSDTALLMQTFVDEEESRAYFVYYGSRDARKSEIIGPFTWGHRAPPPDRVEYTTELPPGQTKKVGGRVPGLGATWFRSVQKEGTGSVLEPTTSIYQARPLYIQVGVAQTPIPESQMPEAVPEEPPSWINF